MLTPAEVEEVVQDLWNQHQTELVDHDRVADYVAGRSGVPSVPEGSGDELKDLARMSVKNVLSLVEDAFTQALSVVGFRSPREQENAAVWSLWQSRQMDARQSEVHRSMVRYGASYVVVLPERVSVRSPRQLFAAYDDPRHDRLPVYALDTWVDRSGTKPVQRGLLLDDEFAYPVALGQVQRYPGQEGIRQLHVPVEPDGDPFRHGSDGCPVVRFVNARDAEDMIRGEIEPLITQQRAINVVNFDRLVVSRFGAFPQKYVVGWTPDSSETLARASAARLMAFPDELTKVGDFAQASVEPYNSILQEMIQHVAMSAQIPPFALTGDILNIAAEAAAMVEAPYHRKCGLKRESAGESWELYLRLDGALNGVDVPEDAEVIWAGMEARSFGAVVDGVTKLAASGVPIESLLEDIPGWSQQKVDAAKAALRRNAGRGVLETLQAAASSTTGEPVVTPADQAAAVKAQADAMGILIRAGVTPEDAANAVGLGNLTFTGAVPVTLRVPEREAARLED